MLWIFFTLSVLAVLGHLSHRERQGMRVPGGPFLGSAGLGPVGFDELFQGLDADLDGTGGVLTHGHE